MLKDILRWLCRLLLVSGSNVGLLPASLDTPAAQFIIIRNIYIEMSPTTEFNFFLIFLVKIRICTNYPTTAFSWSLFKL